MNPDGSINTVGWRDFSERSLHELAEKTKALTRLYYGRAHQYAYWDGFSTGGVNEVYGFIILNHVNDGYVSTALRERDCRRSPDAERTAGYNGYFVFKDLFHVMQRVV